jgi:hypothetical protein
MASLRHFIIAALKRKGCQGAGKRKGKRKFGGRNEAVAQGSLDRDRALLQTAVNHCDRSGP